LTEGTKAPFTGYLLSDAALAKLLADSDAALARCKLEAGVQARQAALHLSAEQKLCKANGEAVAARLKVCEDVVAAARAEKAAMVKECVSPPWYKGRELFFVLGSVLGGGVCAGTAAAIR